MFATKVYQKSLSTKRSETRKLNQQLALEAHEIAALDRAGQKWSNENYKNGFTSYASANELHKRSSTFERLEIQIRKHVNAYARELAWDLGGGKLEITTCWVNIMPQNTHHGLHLHPLSVISGTYYVDLPKGTPGIKFEDPRIERMMAAPPIRANARDAQRFTLVQAKPGDLILFESWLRHEVPLNSVKRERISISFNYDWV